MAGNKLVGLLMVVQAGLCALWSEWGEVAGFR